MRYGTLTDQGGRISLVFSLCGLFLEAVSLQAEQRSSPFLGGVSVITVNKKALTIGIDNGYHLYSSLECQFWPMGLQSLLLTLTPAIDLNRKMALGRLPNKSRAPVKNPFPSEKFRNENRLCARRRHSV